MASPDHEDHQLMLEDLREIARNWNIKDMTQIYPQQLWPMRWDDDSASARSIARTMLEISRYRVDYDNIFEEISHNGEVRLGSAIDSQLSMIPEDVQPVLAQIQQEEFVGARYRRDDVLLGAYKEELLEHIKTTWGTEPIDILPDEIRPPGEEDLQRWFHVYIPALSAMTKVAINVEEIQREIVAAIKNRRSKRRGIGRPKNEDRGESIGVVRPGDLQDAYRALVEAHRLYNIGNGFSPDGDVQNKETGRDSSGEKTPEYVPEMLQAMREGRHSLNNDNEPADGFPAPSHESSDVEDIHQRTPVPQRSKVIGKISAIGLHGDSLDGRINGLPNPPFHSMLGRMRPRVPMPQDGFEQPRVGGRTRVSKSPVVSPERGPSTPANAQASHHDPSRPPYLSTGQMSPRREARDRPIQERPQPPRRREAGSFNADIAPRRVAGRKRGVEEIEDRLDFLDFGGYEKEFETPEDMLMTLRAEDDMSRMTQKRLKTEGAWSLVEGRRRYLQLMLEVEERKQRARQEAAAAADADLV